MDDQVKQKIQDLQIIEQNLQSLLMQKQNANLELNETVNALEEVKATSEGIYKMIGSIIVLVDKEKTISELEEKKKLLELRNDSIVKQENMIESRARNMQQEIQKILEEKSPSASK